MTSSRSHAALNLSVAAPRFHLLGHDHGALLGWECAASTRGAARLASYTSLSVPHPDAFNRGLYGPSADVAQQVASQYFTMFVLNSSASLHGEYWFKTLGKGSGDADSGSFESAAAFQKALWWYNGAVNAGVMGLPPLMSAVQIAAHGDLQMAALRVLFGGTPNNGTGAARPTGQVAVPALFVCGKSDPAILCDRPYARNTSAYVTADYQHLAVDCAHDLLSCKSNASTEAVVQAFLRRVGAGAPRPRERDVDERRAAHNTHFFRIRSRHTAGVHRRIGRHWHRNSYGYAYALRLSVV
jgi:pimeloyl-ACP methyl ester carboxylesterase